MAVYVVLCRPTFPGPSTKQKSRVPCSKMVKNFKIVIGGHSAKREALQTAEPVRPHGLHILEASPGCEACTGWTNSPTPPTQSSSQTAGDVTTIRVSVEPSFPCRYFD